MNTYLANRIAADLIRDAAMATLSTPECMGFQTNVGEAYRTWVRGTGPEPWLKDEVLHALQALAFHIYV